MTGAEQQNQNIEGQNNQNKVQFEKNLADIRSILDTEDDKNNNGKKLDDSDKISKMLDCDFKEGLSKLGNKKERIKELSKMTDTVLKNNELKNNELNKADSEALETLQTFLLPFVVDVSEGMQSVDAEGKAEGYNKNEGKEFIEDFKKQLKDEEKYNNLPGIDTIQKALENPSEENIQILQNFLLNVLQNSTQKLAFYNSSFDKKATAIPTDNKETPDGGFGPGTQTALKNYLDAFSSTYQKQTQETEDIASETSNQNAQEQLENKQETKDTQEASKLINQEIAKDNSSEKAIDEANLAGVLTSAEVSKLNDKKTLQIDGDNVVYRGEKIPFADLGIARTKSIQPNTGTGLSNTDLVGQNQSQEISNEIILNDLKSNNSSGLIGINGKSSDQIRKDLVTKKFEIDNKVDELLKNSITYDEINNEYKYRSQNISRDDIGEGKTTLQQRQNKIDRGYANLLSPERIVDTQTSTDGKTNRKIIDLAGDNGQKIIINKENSDGSTTKTVDATRGDNSKVVTTQRDSEGNISNESKIKEDTDGFKEKEKNITMPTGKELEPRKVEARATSDDVYNAINKHMKNDPSIAFNYDVIKNGDTIRIQLSDNGGEALGKNEFQNAFKKALSDAGILQIDMQNYKFKGEKVGNNEKVDKLVFKVGLDSKKQTPNTKESAKFDEVKPDTGRQEIPSGEPAFLYARVGTQKTLYARQQADRVVKTFAKFDGKEWIYDIKEEDPNIKTIQEQTKQQK